MIGTRTFATVRDLLAESTLASPGFRATHAEEINRAQDP